MPAKKMDFNICGARFALSAGNSLTEDLSLRKGKIWVGTRTEQRRQQPPVVDCRGYLLLPGLVNPHDHLEFGVFPRLGRGSYGNWQAWATDIYKPDESPLRELLAIPKPIRLWLGGLRNLLAGVTTVAHHNPYQSEVFEEDFPVKVLARYGWAHSLSDPIAARQSYTDTPNRWPFFLHFAEGTDPAAFTEFELLHRLIPINDRLVLIHAVGVTPSDYRRLSLAGTSLVWCPSSNNFTLGKTIPAETVLSYPFLTLGSDSPLTSVGDLLDELRYARFTSQASAELLYEMVTTRAAQALRLSPRVGVIMDGSPADLVILRDNGRSPAKTLVSSSYQDVECVIKDGEIQLLSLEFAERVPTEARAHLQPVSIGAVTRLLPAPARAYIREVEQLTSRPWNLRGAVV